MDHSWGCPTASPMCPSPFAATWGHRLVLVDGLPVEVTRVEGFKSLCPSPQPSLPLEPYIEMAELQEQSSLVC